MTEDKTHFHREAVHVLETALRDNGRPIALLIGAGGGCSIRIGGEPLIPAIAELTELVKADAQAKGLPIDVLEKSFIEDGIPKSTVEDWLSRLRTLLTIVGDQTVRGLNHGQIEAIESAIVESIANRVAATLPEAGAGYASVASWASGFDRTRPLEIFTLSYDLLMEQALERAQVSYFDGFLGSHKPFLDLRTMEEDTLPSRWTRLWKMHGSINWKLKDGMAFRSADWEQSNYVGALIHPSHMKYDQSRRMPYLAMQDRLRSFMKQPGATLVTIGYSFGDQHINELIEEGLRVNGSSVCFGLLYETLATYPGAEDLPARRPNLRIYAEDAGVFNSISAPWDSESAEGRVNLGDFNEFGHLLHKLAVI